MARAEIVRTATVQATVRQALAQVGAVIIDQKAAAGLEDLPAKREIDAVFTQGLEHIARAPAQIGILDLGCAFATIGETASIAVAPGTRGHHGKAAVGAARIAKQSVGLDAVLDKGLLPMRTALGSIVVFTAVEQTVGGQAFEADMGVRGVDQRDCLGILTNRGHSDTCGDAA
ncbi:hypothetical protein D3C81_911410 [compost metagenome]